MHLVCIYDPVHSTQAIYTNGVLCGAQTATVPLSGVSTNSAALGRSPWWAYGDPYLAGAINEVRIYAGRLLPDEIALAQALGPDYPLTPTLAATIGGGNVTLAWPTNYASPAFTLVSSPALGSSASWTAVGTTPTVVGANYRVVVPATNAAQFFRLHR